MLIGGSCGGRYSRPISGITAYENRILQNSEHKYFWQDSKYCIDNGIYLIVNIDTYLTGGRWQPTNEQLRQFVIDTKTRLLSLGANKSNTRFTVDNESNEYCDFEYYMNMVRVVHDALNGDFDLGAGNFHTTNRHWYRLLAEQYINNCYEVFDTHFQDGLNNKYDIDDYCDFLRDFKNTHGFRLAVTEGNNFYNVSVINGHNLLKYQINKADEIGCEQFCYPYVNWMHNGEESDSNMAYCWNWHPVSPYWQDMLSLIASKKPILELDDMKLELLKIGSKGNQVKWLQEILEQEYGFENIGGYDGAFGNLTDKQVREYQQANGLKVDGIIGKDSTFDLIWNAKEYGRDYWWKKLKIYMAFE